MKRAAVVFICLFAVVTSCSAAISTAVIQPSVEDSNDLRAGLEPRTDCARELHRYRFVAASLAPAAGALAPAPADSYRLTVDGSIDVPSRTVEAGGAQFRVDAIARGDPGGALDARVAVPADEPYWLYLYDGDRRIVTGSRGEGPGTNVVALDGIDPGTYVLALSVDGVNERAVPVVVRGYDVALDAPRSVPPNGTVRATVGVEPRRVPNGTDGAAVPNVTSVELVLAGDTETRRVEATLVADGRYAATIDAATLSEADYRAYANVRGRETVSGRRQLLGVSDARNLTVGEPNASDAADRTPGSASPSTPPASPTPTPDPSGVTADGSVITPNASPSTFPTDGSRAPIPDRSPTIVAALLVVLAGLLAVRRLT